MSFFVMGLPRSRTAWLANFLTFDGNFCYHEGLDGCESIDEYKKKVAGKGDSGTGLSLLDMNELFPASPKVIINAPIERAIYFTKALYGIDCSGFYEDQRDRLKRVNGLNVEFDQIDVSLEKIWDHLIGTPYDTIMKDREKLLKSMDIKVKDPMEIDIKAIEKLRGDLCLG